MEILGEGRKREVDKLMATESEGSKAILRNPGITFSWGTRRCLRCVKENPNGEATVVDHKSAVPELDRGSWLRDKSHLERRGSSDRRESFKVPSMRSPAVAGCSGRKSSSDVDDEIEAIRTKLTFDLQTAANRLKDAIVWEGLEVEPQVSTPSSVPVPVPVPVDDVHTEGKAEKPWNLRTRRAPSKDSNGGCGSFGGNDGGRMSLKDDILKPKFSSLSENISSRLRGSVTGGGVALSGQKRERPQFSLSLSRKEIEEDFMAMTGQKLPRRPKKRAKNAQKELEKLFPGTWLREVNADMYKVHDAR